MPTPTEPTPTPTETFATLAPAEPRPITGIAIPRIALTAEVVEAPLVVTGDDMTWLVPSFKAGHAEGTAGAGQVGNAVLFGHVTSRTLGNVFQTLDRTRMDDIVLIASGDTTFRYRVASIRSVPRDAVEVLDPQGGTSVSLITCTGAWNPALNDYMERLVVRADLVESASSGAPPDAGL